jgi:hypothetical protein
MKQKDYVDVSKLIALEVSRLDPATQVKLNAIVKEARTAIILYMVFSSLPIATLVTCSILAKRLRLISFADTKEEFTRPVEYDAYCYETRHQLRFAAA